MAVGLPYLSLTSFSAWFSASSKVIVGVAVALGVGVAVAQKLMDLVGVGLALGELGAVFLLPLAQPVAAITVSSVMYKRFFFKFLIFLTL